MCEFRNLEDAMNEVRTDRHPVDREWFWTELRLLRERWNVLRHPFYVRWTSGALIRRDLQIYAEEYDHLVVALAVISRHAADKASDLLADALSRHAEEERAHIELWRAFASATGWCRESYWAYASDPLPETIRCARDWVGEKSRPLGTDLVTLYVIEAPQPKIARSKLQGLLDAYGFREGSATQYFRLHIELDRDHAALAQAALEGCLRSADPFALLAQADAVHRAYWAMLDGVQRACST
jgi:pyrroloquinoline quinone (PQQ) biosynthesis protein C